MVKATKISGKVNSSKSYFSFIISTFLSIAVQAQNCPGCLKNTEELKVKNKELERINMLLGKNKEVLQVANEKKESCTIAKMRASNTIAQIQLRKKDEFKFLATEINELIEHLNKKKS